MNSAFHFIINPVAGGGRPLRIWPLLKERLDTLGVRYEASVTQAPHDAADIAAAIPQGVVAVAVGGDGTLNEMVRGVAPGRTIGLIPAGRGNDFARTAGISPSPFTALQQLLEGESRPVDLPFVNGRPFLNVAGIGFDAHVAERACGARGWGALPYLSAVMHTLRRYRPRRLTIEVDGHKSEGEVFLLAVGNCRYYAGGMKICPSAHFDDGLLDLCIAGKLNTAEVLLALFSVFRGAHVRQRKIHYLKAHSIRVDGPGDVLIQADGEVLGSLPAEFTLKQRALNVIVPPGAWTPSKVTSIRRFAEEKRSTGSSP